MKKTFKKYSNRRLYDMENKSYVNLDDVKNEIVHFNNVQVLDAKTNEDITNSILLQIINKQEIESKSSFFTSQTLSNLIRMYDNPVSKSIQSSIGEHLEMMSDWFSITDDTKTNEYTKNMNDWLQMFKTKVSSEEQKDL